MKGKGTHGHYSKVYLVVSDTEPENPADGLLWYDPECETTTTTTTCQLPEGLYNLGPAFIDYITFAEPVGTIYPRTIEEACYCYNNSEEAIDVSWISCLSDVEEPTIGHYVYDAANNCLLPSAYYIAEGVCLVIDGEIISVELYDSLCSTTTTTTIQ